MKKLLLLIVTCSLLIGCPPRHPPYDVVHVVENLVIGAHSVPIYPRKAALTTDTARRFSLELPRRCRVDWDNQSVLSVLPEENITMVRLDGGDPLPPYNVEDFKFERKTISEALSTLLVGTDIQIVEDQEIPDRISAAIQSGYQRNPIVNLHKHTKS